MSKRVKNRIVIEIADGLVQEVYADRPGDLEILRIDWDTDGLDDEDLTKVTNAYGRERECSGGFWGRAVALRGRRVPVSTRAAVRAIERGKSGR